MNQNFTDFMEKYRNEKIAVAISGGVDSVCLLSWLVKSGFAPTALHINHGLRTASEIESEYVKELSKNLGVKCVVMNWQGDKPSNGLEQAARNARYKLMTDYCRENEIKFLLTAHQADDQIETFLMHLGRGSGVYGLSAMRRETARDGVIIVRPLLNIFRTELIKYCTENKIKYYNDSMNDDENYTRVKIRKNRKCLSELLGISDDRILLAVHNLSRTREALDKFVDKKIGTLGDKDYVRFADYFLFDEPCDISLKLIGKLIQKISGEKYQPRLKSLEFALSSLGKDCKITLGHCKLARRGNEIIIAPENMSISFRKLK